MSAARPEMNAGACALTAFAAPTRKKLSLSGVTAIPFTDSSDFIDKIASSRVNLFDVWKLIFTFGKSGDCNDVFPVSVSRIFIT